MHENKMRLRYFSELLGTHILFFFVLVVSIQVERHMTQSIEQMLVMLSPLAPFLLIIMAVVRYYRRVDEYLKQVILENWALTAAITVGWTFTYGFLECIGFPRLSMITICPAMGIVSASLFIVRRMVGR